MFLIYDTETSHTPDFGAPADKPGQPRMCAFGAMLAAEDGTLIDTYYSLVQPEGWLPEVIAKAEAPDGGFAVNKLSMAILREKGRPIAQVLDVYENMLTRCEGFVTHNILFDTKIMRGEMRLAGRPDRFGERPYFCAMRASMPIVKALKPNAKPGSTAYKFPRLGEAYAHFIGKELEDAHNAQSDALAAMAIFFEMKKQGLVEWVVKPPREAA